MVCVCNCCCRMWTVLLVLTILFLSVCVEMLPAIAKSSEYLLMDCIACNVIYLLHLAGDLICYSLKYYSILFSELN